MMKKWYCYSEMISPSEKTVFSGRRALVIGGSGGIGRALALALAGAGASVVITGGSSQERLDRTLAELRQKTPAVSGFLCRIGDENPDSPGFSSEKAVEFILNKSVQALNGVPEIVICAWGPYKKSVLAETEPRDWRFLTESNLIFPGILISRVLGGMINSGWGRILLFGATGTAQIRGFTGLAAYSAAKTALGVLAKSAALEAGASGLTCNVICPGLTDTEYCGETEKSFNRKHSPGEKALEPEEIARFAMSILENPGINGAIIPIDRGIII
jgi:3-oxoacyl-[acyl-carrier protein] reductase